MRKIVVEDYNPKWAHAFQELKHAYLTHIREDLRIEHVGSTSVPGLAAKPIIDIDIVVKHPSDILDLVGLLENLGYIYEGELGVPGRAAFKRSLNNVPLLKEHHSKWFPHHLYVVLEDSLAFKNHMALKHYLIENDDAMEEYGALKKALAHKYPHDIDRYIAEKTPLMLRMLKACNFTEDEINEIQSINI